MFDVGCWKPPFTADTLAAFGAPDALAAEKGDVVVVRLTAPVLDEIGAEPHPLVELVHELRVRCPACAVALWIPHAPPQVMIDAVRAGTHAQVRAILGGEPPDPALLRAQLTHPGGLSTFVLRWASDAGYLPPGVEQEDVRELLDAPPSVRTLQRLSLQRQVAARTWRSRLQQLGLPNPHAWLGLAHALRVAFFVQRNSTESLQSLCDRLGMHTLANMSQQFKRVFGLSPSHVRDLLGAEPLLDRWFQTRLRRAAATAPLPSPRP